MRLDVLEPEFFPPELSLAAARIIDSRCKSRTQTNVKDINDATGVLEQWLFTSNDLFYKPLTDELIRHEVILNHVTRVLDPNSIYKDGLLTNSWDRYSCRISDTLLSVGLSEDSVRKAQVCIKKNYDKKYAFQVPQNCFYVGNLLFPSEDRDVSYDVFGACIGGELAGCLEDEMPDVYEVLCNNGTSVNVKCVVPFNDIINIHRNKVAFQFLCYYAAKSLWGIKYEIEFDCATETDVPPNRILDIDPFIYVP